MNQKIIIIGGGAAGFFGAISLATHQPEADITILEASKQLLGKVKISGGGRCNVTHHCFNPSQLITNYPRGGRELRGAFSRFQPQDTVKWFTDRGVKLKTEKDGRMFPITDDSQTIIDCLVNSAKSLGIKIKTQTAVKSIHKVANKFIITLKSGENFSADKILIATGSNKLGYTWAQSLGHTIKPPIPSLFTFKINDPRIKNLAGISSENVHIQLKQKKGKKLEQQGPLLITHWGVSGPAVLKLSAWGARVLYDHNYKMELVINWLPDKNPEIIKTELNQLKVNHPKQKVSNYNGYNVPKRLWQSLVDFSLLNNEKIWAEITKKELEKLAFELSRGIYTIEGKGVFKDEFVTCGGVNLKEIDFKTMASKKCEGLYFAGEILDIDGVTGGFNFQNAWTTGWLFGQHLT